MSAPLTFINRIGYVSGFDTEKDGSTMLVLETLLAAYARIAIQTTEEGKNVVLRAIELDKKIVKGNIVEVKYGRHFVLLPKNQRHNLFQISFEREDKVESDQSGSYKRTVIKSLLVLRELKEADENTIIDEYDNNFHSDMIDDESLGDMQVYYFDVALEEGPVYDKEMKIVEPTKSKMGWRKGGFYTFAIRSTSEDKQQSWHYVSFFNRSDKVETDTQAISTYLRHRMADNVSTVSIKKKKLNMRTFRMDNGEERLVRSIESDPVLDRLPEDIDIFELPIAPSVMFVDEKAYIMGPWAHPFANKLYDYINAIRSSFIFDGMKIIGIRSMRQQPDYETVLGHNDKELIVVITNYTPNSGQRKTNVAIRDSCIARILFGSIPNWHHLRVGNGNDKITISAPGFGCLDYTTCVNARNGIRETGPLWENFLISSARNGEYYEMIGRSADELDGILFEDSSFFRSFIGKSVSYTEAVAHYLTTIGKSDMIDMVKSDIRTAYSDVLGPYIGTVLNHLISSVSRGTPGQQGSKDASNYVPILQEGHTFLGFIKTSASKDTPTKSDMTKLVYAFDETKFFIFPDGVPKRSDGGIFLRCSGSSIIPNQAARILSKAKRLEYVSAEDLTRAQGEASYSSYCPYGYLAHCVYKILEFAGNHIDFFPTTKLRGHIGSEIELQNPHNCSTSLISKGTNVLEATSVEYFTIEQKDNKAKRESLCSLKELWKLYIHTFTFIKSLIVMQAEEDTPDRHLTEGAKALNMAANKECRFGFILAQFLRLRNKTTKIPNIYELLPYDSLEVPKIELDRITNNHQRHDLLEARYKSVFTNFVTNCDTAYRSERLWCMDQCDKIIDQPFKEEQLTNLDYVNGYLLSEDFDMESSKRFKNYPGYFNWKQYLGMSASVYYAKNRENEPMLFTKGAFDAARSGRIQEAPAQLSIKNSRFHPKLELDGKDVATQFDLSSHVVFANISNVPIYNYDPEFGDRKNPGSVVFSTLNEALSGENSIEYIMSSSIAARSKDATFDFDYVRGNPPGKQTAFVNEADTQEFRRKGGISLVPQTEIQKGGIVLIPQGEVQQKFLTRTGPTAIESTKLPYAQDFEIRACSRLPENNIPSLMATELNTSTFIPKPTRCQMLINYASHGRRSLSFGFVPGGKRTSYTGTLQDTILSGKRQVPLIIHPTDSYSGTIETLPLSDANAKRYLRNLGIEE